MATIDTGNRPTLVLTGDTPGVARQPYAEGQGTTVDVVDGANVAHHFMSEFVGAAGAPKALEYRQGPGNWVAVQSAPAWVYGIFAGDIVDIPSVGPTIQADFAVRAQGASSPVTMQRGYITGLNVTPLGAPGGGGSGGTDPGAIHDGDAVVVRKA
jgi:hypothetical protein